MVKEKIIFLAIDGLKNVTISHALLGLNYLQKAMDF